MKSEQSKAEGRGKPILHREAEGMRRRDFLRRAGFTFAAASAVGCETGPVEKAIPYLVPPEEAVPGEALHYASVCGACPAGCGILVKTLDGRPVKLEGNPEHPVSRGGLCAVGQASVLDLYDSARLRDPLLEGRAVSWPDLDAVVMRQLSQVRPAGLKLYVVTRTINSPTTRQVLDDFLSRFENSSWVSYDLCDQSAIREAHERTHGVHALPRYLFERSEVIVSFNADFLGSWISPVEFAQGYRDGRTVESSRLRYSYHVQLESRLTITGAKADRRCCISPKDHWAILVELARALAGQAQKEVGLPEGQAADRELVAHLADRLWKARGRSLVVCGLQDLGCQILVNVINELLGNYQRTLDLVYPSYQAVGSARELDALRDDLMAGEVGALLIVEANPLGELPFRPEEWQALLEVPCSVHLTPYRDETSLRVKAVCPVPHFLESWGDSAPQARVLSLRQPTVRRFGNSRPLVESLSAWMGDLRAERELVDAYWRSTVFDRQVGFRPFAEFWDRTLQDGVARVRAERGRSGRFDPQSAAEIEQEAVIDGRPPFLELHPTPATLDGAGAHNPWLLELPDPLSRVAWGNYLALAPERARELGVTEGDLLRMEDVDGRAVELPALIQPGQHPEGVSAALGFGKAGTQRFLEQAPDWIEARRAAVGTRVGVSLAPLLGSTGERLALQRGAVHLTQTGRRIELATGQLRVADYPAQLDREPEGRGLVRGMSLEAVLSTRPNERLEESPRLWTRDHRYPGHHWQLVVDLGACTGCAACVVACQAENNVPVVGPDEVRRKRSMHWLRIDRYYQGGEWGDEVSFQPMMCQHCDNAPCESVCPVLATVHSEEGVNQQVYNRCIGTRYCSNNCPYKVRAFNWFDYAHGERLENLQLNPDVTVRSRGVMEKCSLCFQRILAARIAAKRDGREIEEGEIRTACQQTCPSRAIVFGDANDPKSRVSELGKSPRSYRLLERLGTEPSVIYLAAVLNRETGEGS